MAPLLVVDAPSMLFRAFYALPDSIKGADGKPVNALLGSVNLVLREYELHEPRTVVMCFGPDAAPYRVELYEGYHADRVEAFPDDLGPQFEDAPAFYEAFGWHTAYDESVEADDLLHSYARAEEAAGGETLIMTGDRDLYQSVTAKTTVLYVKTGSKGAEIVTPAEVKSRYGIPPEQVPDFIALRGDPSDGIPGAKGVGEKTAADLLRRGGDLEGAIKGALRESPRLRSSLRDGADDLRAYLEIARLRELPVEPPPDTPLDPAGGAAAARERGMNRLADRLEKLAASAST
jgi:5'-3' exonuclease